MNRKAVKRRQQPRQAPPKPERAPTHSLTLCCKPTLIKPTQPESLRNILYRNTHRQGPLHHQVGQANETPIAHAFRKVIANTIAVNKKARPALKPCRQLNIGFGSGRPSKTLNKNVMGPNPLIHQPTQERPVYATTNNYPAARNLRPDPAAVSRPV